MLREQVFLQYLRKIRKSTPFCRGNRDFHGGGKACWVTISASVCYSLSAIADRLVSHQRYALPLITRTFSFLHPVCHSLSRCTITRWCQAVLLRDTTRNQQTILTKPSCVRGQARARARPAVRAKNAVSAGRVIAHSFSSVCGVLE